jgi:4-amino-4-deoxy-L-arabinose transferase-like glycosyltransferase
MISSIGNVDAVVARARVSSYTAAIFWAAWLVTLGIHVALAMCLSPFGDEAWYWQESRALDWSFSDIPVATACFIRIGEALFGHGVFGMRSLFLLQGGLIPLILVWTSRRLYGEEAGWRTGLLALALPLLGLMGMFALPDVPLTFFTAIALDQLERAARSNRTRAWLLLGFALAGLWLTHYRAVVVIAAGFCFLILTPRGRTLWRNPKLWLALFVSCLGLVPLLIFNAEHQWVALHFQIVERNPWSFHGDAITEPIEQAIACTPLFYFLLLWAAWRCLRSSSRAPWDLLACCAVAPLLMFFVFGFFADDVRFRLHWPIPGYVPLLIALPVLVQASWGHWATRWFATSAFVVLTIGLGLAYFYLVSATRPLWAEQLAGVKAFPEHFVGWNEAADRTRELLVPATPDTVLVADNFMLAAELDFAFDGNRVIYSLDHPINTKHGRAPQLALWKRDETALRELGKRPVLLVSEPTARRERERMEWMQSLCARVADVRAVSSLDVFGGRKKYRWFAGVVPTADDPAETGCAVSIMQ